MKTRLLILSLGLILLINQKSYATHAAGLDLTYQCIGFSEYTVTVTFYRDCNGIEAPPDFPLEISSVSCGFADSTSFSMPLIYTTQGSDTISHLAGLCPGNSSQCAGGNLQGYEQYIYVLTITLPFVCNDWVIATHISSRNDAISNLYDPGNQDLYEECRLSNANNLCNNSPQFSNVPLVFACVDDTFRYNRGVYDPDGDSLVFSLANPLSAAGVAILYENISLSPEYPLFTTTGTFDFNPVTGQMKCIPSSFQVAVISMLIEEYRDGEKIGSTQCDMQVIVKACTNNIPHIPDGITNLAGGTLISANAVEVNPGNSLDFDLEGTDADASDSLTIATNLPFAIPSATYTLQGSNPITLHFHWDTFTSDSGLHFFTVTLKDKACPYSGEQIYSYIILAGVSAPTLTGDIGSNNGGIMQIENNLMPGNIVVHFNSPLPDHCMLLLFNSAGELVRQFNVGNTSFVLLPNKGLEGGTYLLTLIEEGSVLGTEKVVMK
ncbi:MAG TPA: hypothetical protein VE978_18100 [Chitinophagales bacterium]|nr:hypothetical protein [Chitinophagales bacterium]